MSVLKKKNTRRFARCILRQTISHASFLSRIKAYQKRLKRDDTGVVPVPKFHSVRSLTGRSGPTETCRSIYKNSRFQSHFTVM